MKANNAPFTVYVATQAIDEGTLYWYDQIINLMKSSEDVICSIEENGKERFFRIQANGKDDQCWKSVQSVLTRLKTLPEEVRHETALRIKKEYGHLTADLRMLTPDELRELSSDPLAEIGCHTHAHELLDQLENSEVHATLSKSNELIEKWTGVCPRHFSYPNGNVNSRVRGLIKSTGFRSAVTTKSQHCSGYDEPFTLPRIGIGRFDSRSHFKAKLAGFL
jgi:peptidoglycan/xylan/chitin deacetylase (PgdA/CDA1 family)